MDLSQGSKELLVLAKGAYKGEVMLPDFQRNFVWARQDIEELIKSLLEDMFIGNFLTHNVSPHDPPFKPIAIEGAPLVNKEFKANPTLLILDGQQRLSSLFYALYSPDIPLRNATNPYAFFINIPDLINDDIENSVYSTSKAWRDYKSLVDENDEYIISRLVEEQIIPLTFLTGDFTEVWFEHFKSNYSNEADKKVRAYIRNITEYNALTLDVPINEQPENIAVLFERINRTGIKLSIFDLLVARLYKFINLREKWETAFEENDLISKYAQDNKRDTQIPYYFIQALALNNGLSIKARDMLKINDTILNGASWTELVGTVENNVLNRLLDVNEYGIARLDKWLPYSPMIVPLITFFLKDNFKVTKINNWYWSSVFSERYAGSVESKITKDTKDVIGWFANDETVPDVIKNMRDILDKTFDLKEKDNAGNSVYKGVFNLLFRGDAKDFYEDDKIKYKKSELDDHHIFPKKFLENKGVESHVNTILNRTLIHGTTNRSISKKSPADYIKVMIKKNGSEQGVINLLEGHFITEEMYRIMKEVDDDTPSEDTAIKFNQFLELREEAIKDEIRKLIQ